MSDEALSGLSFQQTRQVPLRRLVDTLGATILRVASGSSDLERNVSGGVVLYDPLDQPELLPDSIVLAIGLGEQESITELLHTLGAERVAALIVREPVPTGELFERAALRSGVAVLGLTRGATWLHLAGLLRSVLSADRVDELESETLLGGPSGDLFALANAIAALVDAPLTIEDRENKVLAFSNRQDEADPSRVATILGRRVPDWVVDRHETDGNFWKLYSKPEPLYMPPVDAQNLGRVAIAIRAGDEILGSIWVAIRSRLTAERDVALRESAKVVALELLRLRAGADASRRVRAELVGTAIDAGPNAPQAFARLGLTDHTVVVVALAIKYSSDGVTVEEDAQLASSRRQVADAFAVHLSSIHPRSATALIGGVCYALISVSGSDPEQRAQQIAVKFLARTGLRVPVVIGIGLPAVDAPGLGRSRAAADRAVKVLTTGRGTRQVARLRDVLVDWLLLELADLMKTQGDIPAGRLHVLVNYDATHRTTLAQTLQAWLESFGNIPAASAKCHVHPNTFRYRLRRAREISGIDLDDADERFAAALQLRLMVAGGPG